MKICLVTTFPPSTGGLSEYGLHIAEELRRNPFLSLTVLADRMSPAQPELDGFDEQHIVFVPLFPEQAWRTGKAITAKIKLISG